jgi:DNA-binding HxlR family transcriptional regulator
MLCKKHRGRGNALLSQSPVARDPDIETFRSDALNCPLPPSIELIGERWAFLILRGAFNGLRHFEQFQAGLGIARNILSNRLARLVEGGILERRSDPSDRRKVIYSLSAKGEALFPVLIALRQWGQDWGHGKTNILLADKRDGIPVRRIRVQGADGRDLTLGEVMWIDRASGKPLKPSSLE